MRCCLLMVSSHIYRYPIFPIMKKHLRISLLLLSAFVIRGNAQDARWGYQLSFDGTNDYFTANSISPVVSGSDWTIEFWFNPSRTVSYTEAIASFTSSG